MVDENPENQIERPLECGKCKKPIKVFYTEIIGNTIVRTCMCGDCPELQRRLRIGELSEKTVGPIETLSGVNCGNCGTTLEQVQRGHLLGCEECYNVFGDVLISELHSFNKIPGRLFNVKKTLPLHIGRTPGETLSVNLGSRLSALNEALNETLTREDYEQAALLRDQIRALTENQKLKTEKNEKEENPL